MRSLVVGFGSIGALHARILREEGNEVAVVSRRRPEGFARFPSVRAAVAEHRPGYVVIANRTVEHLPTLEELAATGYTGRVLVEKPMADRDADLPDHGFELLAVGYNLRFHPGLRRLRDLLTGERVLSVHARAGQYLPDWRPGRDYRAVYSAQRTAGGGVLRDLSHELDFLSWLFGSWTAATALGGTLSSLQIDSEDTVMALLAFQGCPAVSLHLDYLDRRGRRSLLVQADGRSLELDLAASTLRVDPPDEGADGEIEHFRVERDDTYRAQHRAVLAGCRDELCGAEEAREILRLIAAIERAMVERVWVAR